MVMKFSAFCEQKDYQNMHALTSFSLCVCVCVIESPYPFFSVRFDQ